MPEEWTGKAVGLMHVKRISFKTLADKLGWNVKYLSAVLNGHRKPKDAEARIMSALNELLSDAD